MTLENGIKQSIEGDTLDECKKKLYELYGRDYSIENRESKFKRYGFLGLKQKEVQVVYYTVNHRKAYDSENMYDKENEELQLERNRRAILEKQNSLLLSSSMSQMSSKLDEMTKQIEELSKKNLNAGNEQHETIKRIEELLEQNEFTMSYIKMIEDKIRNQFSLDDLEDFKLVERYVIDWIGESIQIAQQRVFRPPHVFIIVGPTGVGKTTTIAKLASNAILDARKNGQPRPEICLLTIDTMRVGAQEQLTKFGDILDKAVLKAESADDVRQIYEEYKDHVDYIFIDTSGYSPNDSMHISQMKNMLDVNMNPDIYLSISATTKASDLQNIFRNYEPFGYESVIITKCDETKQFGNVISVLWDKHKSISYICDGQGVPRNIRRADVIEFLKNLSGFDVDRVHIEDKFGEK
jgi:flagellar biosynthesis protein FlhF